MADDYWYIDDSQETHGPMSAEDFGELIEVGTIRHDSFVWNSSGKDSWVRLENLKDVDKLFSSAVKKSRQKKQDKVFTRIMKNISQELDFEGFKLAVDRMGIDHLQIDKDFAKSLYTRYQTESKKAKVPSTFMSPAQRALPQPKDFTRGRKIMVAQSEGDMLEARIVETRDGFIRVDYINEVDLPKEWISKSSSRLKDLAASKKLESAEEKTLDAKLHRRLERLESNKAKLEKETEVYKKARTDFETDFSDLKEQERKVDRQIEELRKRKTSGDVGVLRQITERNKKLETETETIQKVIEGHIDKLMSTVLNPDFSYSLATREAFARNRMDRVVTLRCKHADSRYHKAVEDLRKLGVQPNT